jgi:hypothetical protein
MSSAAAKVLKLIEDSEIEYVDLRFTDPKGKWQHLTMVAAIIDEDMLTDGFMFDGSSIAGWKAINESDMILMPDLDATFVDPFAATPMLILVCNIVEPSTGELYARDPRSTATRAEAYLKATGIGDTCSSAPKPNSSCSTMSASRTAMRQAITSSTTSSCRAIRGANMKAATLPPPARQGRLLPCRAGGFRGRYPRRDGLDDDRDGLALRQASP